METPAPVTVIALCYNHERFIEECLNSVAAQNYPDIQLIITDDASSDDSAAVLRRWIAERWPDATLIAHSQNVGLCATLNEALAVSTGRYVSLIATDDVMEPEKLSRQVEQIEAAPETVAVIYSDVLVIDELGAARAETYGDRGWWFDVPPEGKVFDELLRLNFIPAVSALIRRSAIESVGGYDESLVFEDWDMWLRLADRFEIRYSPYVSARHRVLSTSLYHTGRIPMAESKVRLLSKWLGDDARRARVIGRIRQEAHYIYEHDRRASLPYLRLMCELQGGARPWARYLLAKAGVGHAVERRLVSLLPGGQRSVASREGDSMQATM